MAGQLPTELYIFPRPGGSAVIERMCAQATNRPASDVVAVAVAPENVAQTADLLFGTGVGVVSTIDDLTIDLIDQVRRSVAQGATEIALPPMVLDQTAMLTRLRSRLGPVTPVTVCMTDTDGGVDLAAAAAALRLGADYISFAPRTASPAAHRDIAALLGLAQELQLGGVKIVATDANHLPFLQSGIPTLESIAARLCMPMSSDRR